MSDALDLLIDLSEAGLALALESLEVNSQRLSRRLRDGLAEAASLAQATVVKRGGEVGWGGFVSKILRAKTNLWNVQTLLPSLKIRIAVTTLKLEYRAVKLEYRMFK